LNRVRKVSDPSLTLVGANSQLVSITLTTPKGPNRVKRGRRRQPRSRELLLGRTAIYLEQVVDLAGGYYDGTL
jgi:hypothetical protein